jgi:asparagine synthase (glutamine-hydrolysing)
MYLQCKVMRQDATVAVSCGAADEVFGGHEWFFNEETPKADMFPWQTLFGQHSSPWWSSEVKEKIRPREYLARRYQEARSEVPTLPGENAFNAKMREISYMDLTRFLPLLLDSADRMSMAVGLEVRLPFSDHRLMEYVWNIPWEMKTVDNIEKGLLRRVFADLIPREVRNRRQCLYPALQHAQYQRGVSTWLSQILNDPNAPIRPFLNVPSARALAEGNLPDLPGSLRVSSMEQIIKINAWLQEYQVSIR